MELISTFLAIVAGVGSAIIGHFVSHDLYDSAPRYARFLLEKAVRVLPESERERYSEEWLAHLEECKGVIPKFRHAIECRMTAWKLRQIFERQRPELEEVEIKMWLASSPISVLRMNLPTATIVMGILGDVKRARRGAAIKYPPERVAELAADHDVDQQNLSEFFGKLANLFENDNDVLNYEFEFFGSLGEIMTDDQLKEWVQRHRTQ